PAKKKVHEWVRSYKARGIVVEQCLIAAGLQRIAPEDFIPEIDVVENGYISMIGYQAKGYSQVPMD
ncbi:MAG: sulfur reduction protein DsrE, partial [Desulfobulbaceae bacterium]|nr:sulfur reduction protein DsrE [Candidatus Desulfobia pelagia]